MAGNMTKQEWLSSTRVGPMLKHLRGKKIASERKLRLFACGCCRRVWDSLRRRSQAAVEITERFVDGEAEEAEFVVSKKYVQSEWEYASHGGGAWAAGAEAAYSAMALDVWLGAKEAAEQAALAAFFQAEEDRRVLAAERRAQADLLRCIFGPGPPRRIALNRSWLAGADGAVVQVAEGIYAEDAFERLPILADALEEAGCTSKPLLEHCRQPASHARGCWAVDLLLAKE